MKQLLLLSSFILLFSCGQNEEQKNGKLNESNIKIRVLNVNANQIDEQNRLLISQRALPDSGKVLKVFRQFDGSLTLIRDELISVTGGYTREGLYFNPPAFEQVNSYFYGENNFRNHASEFFFKNLDKFTEDLNSLEPKSNLNSLLNTKFKILSEHYNLKNKKDLFKNLSVNEAVELLEGFRRLVAFEQSNYILTKK